jgi:hypothetical protein
MIATLRLLFESTGIDDGFHMMLDADEGEVTDGVKLVVKDSGTTVVDLFGSVATDEIAAADCVRL